MKQANWFKDIITCSTNKCPKCHSILISSMGSNKTNTINYHCNKCKHEWDREKAETRALALPSHPGP